jgi:hypothetical protein
MCKTGMLSMRLTALREFGGPLLNLYDSRRFDSGWQSRTHSGSKCRKDFRCNSKRDYKPWQRQ